MSLLPGVIIEDDHDRAPQLLAAFWVPFPFLVALVAARMAVRYKMRNIGVDDWLMLVALLLLAPSLGLSSVMVTNGGGRHLYHIDPEKISTVLKYNFLAQPFGIAASAFAKISVAMFLALRIMGPGQLRHKWFLFINTIIYALLSFITTLFVFIQCNPARALWNKVPGAKCWSPNIATNVSIAQAAYGAYFDFLLALLPVTVILRIQLSMKRKVGLCILLGLGVFGGICAAIKTSELNGLNKRADITWAVFGLFLWSSTEQALVIACGSVPALKPLYDYLLFKRPLDRSRSTSLSANKSLPFGSQKGLNTFGSTTGTTTRVENDDESGLWNDRMGSDQIVVGNTYEVSYLGDPRGSHETS